MLKKLWNMFFGPYNSPAEAPKQEVKQEVPAPAPVAPEPAKVTLPVTTDPLAVKEWPFPGYQPDKVQPKTEETAPVKKPRKPRAPKVVSTVVKKAPAIKAKKK